MLAIDPYVPGKSSAPGAAKIFKLSANETPLGPSPRAKEAIRAFADRLEDYPDGAATRPARGDRRQAWDRSGHESSAAPARMKSSTSSPSAYIGPGDEGIFTEHGFLVYRIAILAAGGVPIVAQRNKSHRERRCHSGQGRPKNQNGLPRQSEQSDRHLSAVRRGRAAGLRLPSHVLLVLDAAYAEYVTRADYAAGRGTCLDEPKTS